MVAWIRSLLMPLDDLYGRFVEQRNKHLYNLAHNGQKCYLRKALNDRFDPHLRRITIDEPTHYAAVYIFTEPEDLPIYLEPSVYLYAGEEHVGGTNFVVRIPRGLSYLDLEIKALIDYYKIASKKYTIYYE